jgi:general secretion pathway protein N
MNIAHQRRLTPVLGVVVVLLGVLFLLLLGGMGRGVRWAPPRSLPPLPPAGNRADLPHPEPLQQFSLVWQKPLFNPDRRPTAHAAAGDSNLGDLELTGIIITPDLRMALLHDKNGNKEIRLREGAALPDGSVTLIEVHQRSAVFDSSSGRTELKLPAGAPIDPLPAGGEGRDQPPAPPGAASIHVQQGADAAPPPSALERLRRTVQKRRAERAAASHEGDH